MTTKQKSKTKSKAKAKTKAKPVKAKGGLPIFSRKQCKCRVCGESNVEKLTSYNIPSQKIVTFRFRCLNAPCNGQVGIYKAQYVQD